MRVINVFGRRIAGSSSPGRTRIQPWTHKAPPDRSAACRLTNDLERVTFRATAGQRRSAGSPLQRCGSTKRAHDSRIIGRARDGSRPSATFDRLRPQPYAGAIISPARAPEQA